jgi:hypothetical protein
LEFDAGQLGVAPGGEVVDEVLGIGGVLDGGRGVEVQDGVLVGGGVKRNGAGSAGLRDALGGAEVETVAPLPVIFHPLLS